MGAMEESRAVGAVGAESFGVDALHRLYDSEVDEVFGFVYRRCGDAALTQDIVHDVFVSAARRVADGEMVPGAGWLYSSARSRVVDHWRREARRDRKLRLISGGGRFTEPDLAELVVSGDELAQVLSTLSPQHRAVLVLKYVDGFSTDEVAREIGSSRKAVESMLARARSALVTALEEVER